MDIIEKMENKITKKINMFDNLMNEIVNNIEDKIIFDFGIEEKFDRPNLHSYYNIQEIYDKHKKNHGDCEWNNINTFTRIQKNIYSKI